MLTHVHSTPLCSLNWWMDLAKICRGVPFALTLPSVALVTDASIHRWGAPLWNLRTQGLWSHQDLTGHISIWELWTICLACWVFLLHIASCSVQILTDNTVVIFDLNEQRGPNLTPFAKMHWAFGIFAWRTGYCWKHVISWDFRIHQQTDSVGHSSETTSLSQIRHHKVHFFIRGMYQSWTCLPPARTDSAWQETPALGQ